MSDQIRVGFDHADDAYMECDHCARHGIGQPFRVAGEFSLPDSLDIDALIEWKRAHVAELHRVIIDAE